jgi:hypothetical protein
VKVDRRRKLALWRRINSPVVIPVGDTERADAAVRAWIDDIFAYFDIDRAASDRWEQVFWPLAVKAFPNFRLVAATGGAPKKIAQRAELLSEFAGYRTRERGSKYKRFLGDHRAACAAAGVKTENGLKAAILKAQREHKLRSAIDAIQAQHQRNLAGPAVKSATKSPTKSDAK